MEEQPSIRTGIEKSTAKKRGGIMKTFWLTISVFILVLFGNFTISVKAGQDNLAKLQEAAQQGDANAQYNLGVLYLQGDGVPQNHKQAVKWIQEAARQGNAEAQYKLGLLYANNMKWSWSGVPVDYTMDYMWLNLSAAQGNKAADQSRDRIVYKHLITHEQIMKAQEMAQNWKPSSP